MSNRDVVVTKHCVYSRYHELCLPMFYNGVNRCQVTPSHIKVTTPVNTKLYTRIIWKPRYLLAKFEHNQTTNENLGKMTSIINNIIIISFSIRTRLNVT
jgi:hypothetical protein